MKQRDWTEADWDRLIRGIRQGQVIPIVGERLSLVEQNGIAQSYISLLAAKLVKDGLLDAAMLRPDSSLAELAQAFVAQSGDISDLYDGLLRAAEQITAQPAKPLVQLASITDFRLYVTLGIDRLLEQSLEAARPSDTVEHRVFRPGEAQDISAAWPATHPTVYHLFGRMSALPDYVVSREDLLEFMHTLQSGHSRPRELFARLSRCSLLIIGTAFSDWLALFFMRMSSELRLSNRTSQLILVDDERTTDTELGSFASHFGKRIRLVGLPAETFVAELYARWGTQSSEAPVTEYDVFISYASENRLEAEALRAGLLAHYPRLGIWLDQKGGLEAGDDYARTISQQIRQAKVFVPIIPARAVGGESVRFYQREWAWAEARAFELGDVPFILPVCTDSTPDYTRSDIPDTFRRFHWSTLPAGAVSAEFAQRVVDTVRSHKKRGVA